MARTKRGQNLVWVKDQGLSASPLLGAKEALHMRRKAPQGSKVRGQHQAIKSLAFPRLLCIEIHLGWEVHVHLREGSWDRLARGGQSKMIGQKEDKDPENCPLIKDLNFPKARLSEFACVSFRMYFAFPIKFLLFSLPSASLPEFFLDKAGKNWGSRS